MSDETKNAVMTTEMEEGTAPPEAVEQENTGEAEPDMESPGVESQVEGTEAAMDQVAVQKPQPGEKKDNSQDQTTKLTRILAMKVPVIVKIAQKKIPFSEVLKFHIGTVIQFDKDPYQYVDLMANNSKIGAGQPVKVAENFGLKVMQIGPVADTIRSLGGGAKE
jgi:flagellar motor switch protein FliN